MSARFFSTLSALALDPIMTVAEVCRTSGLVP